MFNFSDRDSWYLYVQSKDAQKAIGIEQVANQTYNLTGITTTVDGVRSMLTIYELGLLYALAKDHWTSKGAIVDAGPLLGASSFAFGLGLARNDRVPLERKKASIYSYDLWIEDEYYHKFFGTVRMPKSLSLLYEFNQINKDFLAYIVPHQGDFCKWQWEETPIEILFMDLAKTWKLNQHYVRTMLPHLTEGGVLVQQDYVHFNEYWVHITMEYFSENFKFIDSIYGATAYFLVKNPLSVQECQIDLEALPYSRKMDLLESARHKMPTGVQEVMKSAAAKLALDNNDVAKAEALLNSIEITPNEDPVYNFSGIAHSNRKVMQTRLFDIKARAGF